MWAKHRLVPISVDGCWCVDVLGRTRHAHMLLVPCFVVECNQLLLSFYFPLYFQLGLPAIKVVRLLLPCSVASLIPGVPHWCL